MVIKERQQQYARPQQTQSVKQDDFYDMKTVDLEKDFDRIAI